MNLDLDREVAANNPSSRPVDGDPPWPLAGRMLFSSEETDLC